MTAPSPSGAPAETRTAAPVLPGTRRLPGARRVPPCDDGRPSTLLETALSTSKGRSSDTSHAPRRRTAPADSGRSHRTENARSQPRASRTAGTPGIPASAKTSAWHAVALRAKAACSTKRGNPRPSRARSASAQNVSKWSTTTRYRAPWAARLGSYVGEGWDTPPCMADRVPHAAPAAAAAAVGACQRTTVRYVLSYSLFWPVRTPTMRQ